MKNVTVKSILFASLLIQIGCGGYNKNIEGLEELKANAKKENDGRDLSKPQVIIEYRTNEKLVTQEKQIAVPTAPEKVVEKVFESRINGTEIVISLPRKMSFIEGKSNSYEIKATSGIPGVKIALKSSNLPNWAKLESSSKADTYTLSGTPHHGTIEFNQSDRVEIAKLDIEILETPNEATKKTLDGLVKDKEIELVIERDRTPPSNLAIEGLPSEINEGTETEFSVTAIVPGYDEKSSEKPELNIAPDRIAPVAGQNFIEMDGTRYIPESKITKTYLGDSKWKFTLVFDTKNITPLSQLATDGSVLKNADGQRVRVSFRVSNSLAASTTKKVVQLKIKYAQEVTAPTFDLSSLGGNDLKVAPGDTFSGKSSLQFMVSSASAKNQVKVEVSDLSSISGAPKIECKTATNALNRQICSLQWSVPCNVELKDLTQKITLTAQSILGDKKSEVVQQEITTSPADKANARCDAKTVVPVETKKPVTPAPAAKKAPAKKTAVAKKAPVKKSK